MEKDRTFSISAINIVIHPHSAEKYVELWRKAFKLRQPVELRSRFKGLIGSLYPVERGTHTKGIQGEIYKYFDLDPQGAWFNLESAKEAAPEDLNQIRIPARLKPDLALFNYVFFPKGHLLVYESKTADSKSLGPKTVEKLLDKIFSHPRIQQEFGDVEVTAIPERDSLNALYRIPRLSTFIIDLRKPNADDLSDFEDAIMSRMDTMHARRLQQQYVAERGKSLDLDDKVKALAEVAKENGAVTAKGYDADGTPVTKTTSSMPLIEATSYDPNVTDAKSVLLQKAHELHEG